jgi:hypothetical protein
LLLVSVGTIAGTLLGESELVLSVKARPYYEPLFSILDGLRPDGERRYWIECLEAHEDNCGIEADTGQASTGVEILFQMSDMTSTCLAMPSIAKYE